MKVVFLLCCALVAIMLPQAHAYADYMLGPYCNVALKEGVMLMKKPAVVTKERHIVVSE